MAKPYIKLDLDWREDAKVILFEKRYKKAALVDLIQLFVLMSEFGGLIDMEDEATQLRVQKVLGKSAHDVEVFFDRCAACGIIDATLWSIKHASSERGAKDAEARRNRREYAIAASAAAAEKRALKTP